MSMTLDNGIHLTKKFIKGPPRALVEFLETKARSVVITLVYEIHRLEVMMGKTPWLYVAFDLPKKVCLCAIMF